MSTKMPEKSESDIARIARLSGLKPEQVRYDLKGYCNPKGNQLEVMVSDNQALRIISEKRNNIVWLKVEDIGIVNLPEHFWLSDGKDVIKLPGDTPSDEWLQKREGVKKWVVMGYIFFAYITPDMLPKREDNA